MHHVQAHLYARRENAKVFSMDFEMENEEVDKALLATFEKEMEAELLEKVTNLFRVLLLTAITN